MDLASLPLVLVAGLSAFWCACAVTGAVRAALWTVPALGAVILAAASGIRLGEGLGNAGILDFIVTKLHPAPLSDGTLSMAPQLAWLVVATLVIALVQSYRVFRIQSKDSIPSVLRYLLPVAIVAFLCGAFLGVSSAFLYRPYVINTRAAAVHEKHNSGLLSTRSLTGERTLAARFRSRRGQ